MPDAAMDEKLTKLRLAVKYYYIPVRSALVSEDDHQTIQDIIDEISSDYGFQNDNRYATHRRFIIQALKDFYRMSWCELISDAFADQFVKANEETSKISSLDEEFKKIEDRYLSLGDSSHSWLSSALTRISKQFSPEDFTLLRSKSPKKDSTDEPQPESQASEVSNEPVDVWEPIKLDRQSPKYTEAVSAAEAALREIEGSNGYASSDPEERNGLVATIKGSLDALKNGAPSRQSLVHGLLKPLEYVVKKFTDSTMGEIAKVAVIKLIAFLFG